MNSRHCQTEEDANVKDFVETRPDNSLIRSYVWGTDLSGTMQGAGGVGGLLEMSYYGTSTTNCFPAYDGNGNVSALINVADGTEVANYDYATFGEPIRVTGVMAKNNPIRFSTKYDDDESDLLYYGYRYYKPSTGTWPNRDPIEEKGGINLYEFVNDSPIDLVDPQGLKFGDGKICGNYCGGGYCGGKHLMPGEKCDYNVPVTDALDSCCKTHDKCYDDVAAGKTTYKACDAALCSCSKIARLYMLPCAQCGAISLTTVPIWACYLAP